MSILVDPLRSTGRQLPPGWRRSPLGLVVPDRQRVYDRPLGIDFFAGAGGFSLGFHQAGFHMIAAVEMDPWVAITYSVNLGRPHRYGGMRFHFDTEERGDDVEKKCAIHLGLKGQKGNMASTSADRAPKGKLVRPGMFVGEGWIASEPEALQRYGCEHLWVADIRNLNGADMLATLGLEQGDVAVIVGGPPCQGFSAAGRRDVMDPRNSLVFEYARLITEIMPDTFVMENVPQIESMVTPEGVPVLDAFCLAVSEGGYGQYEALRRALSTTGGKAAVKGARKAKKQKKDGSDVEPAQPTKRTRQALANARRAQDEPQLDLFAASDPAGAGEAP